MAIHIQSKRNVSGGQTNLSLFIVSSKKFRGNMP